MQYLKHYLLILIICSASVVCAQRNHLPAIIPAPYQLHQTNAHFKIDRSVKISYNDSAARSVSKLLSAFVAENYNATLQASAEDISTGKSIRIYHDAAMQAESYTLSIQNNRIELRGDAAGIFYGMQTLQQLFPVNKTSDIILDGVEVNDQPRFVYRGLMLDVSRHFFGIDYIKKFLNTMAMFKLNTFHWHLTDDQGWRIEIKRYPELQQTAAWRKPTEMEANSPSIKDGRYGGFYTQQQIREVVAYAAARHITIIPEIEMPGHAGAALAAKPELGCTGGPYQVATQGGVYKDVYCAGNDAVFAFLQNVIDEVVPLFPGKYIHIGGDETPKDRWKVCPKCQQRIKTEGLKDEHQLQSYFVQRMEKYINSKGKQIIGWDEILEGGLAPNATVMSWRGEAGGIEAAKQHHQVIMSPYTYLYFDYYQARPETEPKGIGGYLSLASVYHYEPYTQALTAAQQQFITGVQANTWAEYIADENHMSYMVYPRALALAEISWSPAVRKNYNDFIQRLPHALAILEKQRTNFRIPEPFGLKDSITISDRLTMKLSPSVEGASVYYTTDGSAPVANGKKASGIININLTTNVPVALKTITVLPSGRKSAVYSATLIKKQMQAALTPADIHEGITFKVSFAEVNSAKDIHIAKPDTAGKFSSLSIMPMASRSKFNMVFEGYFFADTDGIYAFKVKADDGALLYLDSELVVDNDGRHPVTERVGTVPLKKGYHYIKLNYFDAGGGKDLNVTAVKNGAVYSLEKRLFN